MFKNFFNLKKNIFELLNNILNKFLNANKFFKYLKIKLCIKICIHLSLQIW